jgi:nicotinamidase-related amidase
MSSRFELSSASVHMVIDMQRIFAEDTDWRMADIGLLIPNIVAITRALPERSLFTRFVTPHRAEHATGRWQHYYRRWQQFTGAVMSAELVELMAELVPLAKPENVLDKPTYSAFEVPACSARLTQLGADTLIFSGVETDVCVLATLLAAVDRGYRVIAVADALGSSSAAGHRATLEHVLPRMPDQIEIVDTASVLAALERNRIAG